MRLFEMKELPEKAGLAVLDWDNGVSRPQRDEKTIAVPRNGGVEFFPLKEGAQFLLLISDVGSWQRQGFRSVYFGGTDEQPFLVELEADAFAAFARGGETAFFTALKPKLIKDVEQTYRDQEAALRRTKRQGDIFAHALRWPWKGLILHHLKQLGTEVTLKHADVALFGTRHDFRGFIGEFTLPETGAKALVGEGVVEAPDHSPLELKGPHVLAQTNFLQDPKKAD